MRTDHQDFSAQPIARNVLRERYAGPGETSLAQVRSRVAAALANAEAPGAREYYRSRFLWALDAGFIPAGRIEAGAGFSEQRTLINCFVQPVGDVRSEFTTGRPGVHAALEQAMRTMRHGGGVGYNFSHLPPRGARGGAGVASEGPMFYLRLFDRHCTMLTHSQARRGAQMGVLNVDHPDVWEFIAAKQQPGQFATFNFSVGLHDGFMRAVQRDATYELVHVAEPSPEQIAAGAYRRADGLWIYRSLRARAVWDALTRAAYAAAEPGVLFLDTINRANNLAYCETIEATNPCGEQPLPDYGCCCLGSLNLPEFVREPFTPAAHLETAQLAEVVRIAVRMLDNVLDITPWPLVEQRREGLAKRRIGLGVTGLGDALVMLNLRYDSEPARACAARILARIRNEAYAQSVELARERGCFPLFDAQPFLQSPFIGALSRVLRERIRHFGLRNSHLISIAPAGTISLAFADNVSNGIEPAFAWRYRRRRQRGRQFRDYLVEDHAYRLYRAFDDPNGGLPPSFRRAWDIEAIDHVRMAAALTGYVDAGISKTVNVPADCPFEHYQELLWSAWRFGLKGITTFRPNPVSGAVLIEEGLPVSECSSSRCPLTG